MWRHWPKLLFFALIVKPLIFFVMGVVVSRRDRLPQRGPCIVAANHNSHLDTMVLMSLFRLRDLPRVRPVAAADYFLRNRLLAWFSLRVIGIIPIARDGTNAREQLFAACHESLDTGDILIIFPEGSRGEPEKMGALKKGIHHLVSARADCRVVPVYLRGLGKALPKGEGLLVPFNVQAFIGEPMEMRGEARASIAALELVFRELASGSQSCRT